MLAPAFECVLDLAPDHYPLLLAARDRWPALLARLGAEAALDRSGALWVGSDCDAVAQGLRAVGARTELLSGDEARRLQPCLADDVAAGVFCPEDWRIAVGPVLIALRRTISVLGVDTRRERVQPGESPRWPVVLAAGPGSSAFATAAPELSLLAPIKGQLLRLRGGPHAGPVLRAKDIYITPQLGGAIAGATMEPGLADRSVRPEAIARLRASAGRLVPGLAEAPGEGAAGVRMCTPDALPLVGPSATPSVLLATGARRNGWLLAPLVAEMIAAYFTGTDPGPHAAALDPRRFDRAV